VSAIIERIRGAVGREALLGVRLSLDDWIRPERGGLGPAAVREIARELVGTGQLDLLNVSAGARASHYSRSIGSYHHPPAPLLSLTAELRQSIGSAVPVIGVSRVLTTELAEHALESGACDLVGMTRGLIADPDLVAKLGDPAAIPLRPCVSANQGCVDRQQGGLPITCFHNPEVGREHLLGELQPTTTPARVLVVGGGPAGMKAAEIAARRGHRVTLVERGERLGGRLRWTAECGAGELLKSIDWVADELDRHRVSVLLGTEVTAEWLAEERPEAIVLATGAQPAPERLPAGDGSVPLVALEYALSSSFAGRDLLVVDQFGNEEVAMAAERLARDAASLALITPMQAVGAHIGFTLVKDQLVRLYEAGCGLEPSTGARRYRGRSADPPRTRRHDRASSLRRDRGRGRGASRARVAPGCRCHRDAGADRRRRSGAALCASRLSRRRRGRARDRPLSRSPQRSPRASADNHAAGAA
jgi:hypothetical protein